MPAIQKILVANRGEIALRIMRTAREMGIATVGVYSDADRNALHVRYADEAVYIGPPPSSESYLRIDIIINAARKTGADAIHPGYGFLSENSTFARRVEAEGLVFIGPSARSMEIMGSKLAAKAAVAEFNVPLVPGSDGAITDIAKAKSIAQQIGYPVLIKASAGGGGKGMRVVESHDQFEEQMDRAVSEATSAFGDGSVFIEKYITRPRHIEFQVFGDKQGNVIHLFERECSVQRRHQKVIEEAPSSVLTPELREEMGRAAVNVAKAANYFGAGTVEFILDEKLNFYFLEMNTRLQVEHPVTEQITGIDLVKLQIEIASGKPLPFQQEELSFRGHAVEVRVYAEDPANNFLPDIGKLQTYTRPQGAGIRVDDGFEQGMEIPFYYDPMIAKLITTADTREAAIDRMVRAIDEYEITGIETTLAFCRYVMNHQAFRSGDFDTRFVEMHFKPEVLDSPPVKHEQLIASLLAVSLLDGKKSSENEASISPSRTSLWKKNRSNS